MVHLANLSATKPHVVVQSIPVIDPICWGAFYKIRFAFRGLLLWSEARCSPRCIPAASGIIAQTGEIHQRRGDNMCLIEVGTMV